MTHLTSTLAGLTPTKKTVIKRGWRRRGGDKVPQSGDGRSRRDVVMCPRWGRDAPGGGGQDQEAQGGVKIHASMGRDVPRVEA